jgi:hypothetical protein
MSAFPLSFSVWIAAEGRARHAHLLRFETGEVGGFIGESPLNGKRVLDEYALNVNQGAPALAEKQMIQRGQQEPRVI